jgi:glycine/D-amino acid oxidase-like deaminating enzyme
MERIVKVKALDGYHLYLEFEDGLQGEIDLSARLFGPMFEPLRDPEVFSQVGLDEFGVICWPNGADLAPDALYHNLLKKRQEATHMN